MKLFYTACTLIVLSACGSRSPETSRFEVAINGIHGGSLSNNADYAIVGSVQHGGSLWRLNDNERLYNWNHSQDELSVIISADVDPSHSWALSAEAHTMVLWDLSSGQAARFWSATPIWNASGGCCGSGAGTFWNSRRILCSMDNDSFFLLSAS